MQYATKAEPSGAVPRSPAIQASLEPFVWVHLSFLLEPVGSEGLWYLLFSSEDLEKIILSWPSFKPPFMLKQNIPAPCRKNGVQLLPFLFLKPIREKD